MVNQLRISQGKIEYSPASNFLCEAYPDKIIRVTAGVGGEAILIIGSKKTALIDCGMAFCSEGLIRNMHFVLEYYHRSLDLILATHTHYDHIGALSAVKEEWPEAKICASAYAARVFRRPGAIRMMEFLSREAEKLYTGHTENTHVIKAENMQVEEILRENDGIDLGDRWLRVLETPGHTDCCLSFLLDPDRLLFLSETSGCLQSIAEVSSQTLKSYEDTLFSVEKCKNCSDYDLVVPHHGRIPSEFREAYWNLLMQDLQKKLSFAHAYKDTLNEEELIRLYIRRFWTAERGAEQPFPAFCENARYEMRAALNYIKGGGSEKVSLL